MDGFLVRSFLRRGDVVDDIGVGVISGNEGSEECTREGESVGYLVILGWKMVVFGEVSVARKWLISLWKMTSQLEKNCSMVRSYKWQAF